MAEAEQLSAAAHRRLAEEEEQRDDLTVVSPGSPMGRSLLGASAGDEVAYQSPAGPVRITVTAVE